MKSCASDHRSSESAAARYVAEGPAPASTMSAGVPVAHDPAAVVTGAGAEFDDVVGDGHDAHIEFDHDDRVAGIDEGLQVCDERSASAQCSPEVGFVEDVEGVARAGSAGARWRV
jgi:hypothetical protein